MKTKLFLSLALAVVVCASGVFAAPKSRVSMEQAQAIALKRVSGEVEQADTVQRHKKSLYSIFIKRANGVTAHVLVNERGKIKSVRNETPATAKIK
jgi:uncharacterized membrane protein YkoI